MFLPGKGPVTLSDCHIRLSPAESRVIWGQNRVFSPELARYGTTKGLADPYRVRNYLLLTMSTYLVRHWCRLHRIAMWGM